MDPHGLTENRDLMTQARAVLKGKWGSAIGTMFVYMLVVGAVQLIPKAGPLLSLIITGPMLLGLYTYVLAFTREQDATLSTVFSGFEKFALALATYLLMTLFICLWMLLLIVPGIVAALSYSQTFFILADGGSSGAMDALAKSKAMMRDKKWKLFCLYFRFFGWALLCILTLGIGFFWLMPYAVFSYAQFYEDAKAHDAAIGMEGTPAPTPA